MAGDELRRVARSSATGKWRPDLGGEAAATVHEHGWLGLCLSWKMNSSAGREFRLLAGPQIHSLRRNANWTSGKRGRGLQAEKKEEWAKN
uniref:Uncharacterized protein n=1 Tax=Oryza sativa subsp. japonica TaxID=39947 RepID=Q10II8_ORYSJ|nr:hypothetical protein LOC_Os03g34120 [Oryza sativa Japonica Group]